MSYSNRKNTIEVTVSSADGNVLATDVWTDVSFPVRTNEVVRDVIANAPKLTVKNLKSLCLKYGGAVVYVTICETMLNQYGVYINSYMTFRKYELEGANLVKKFSNKRVKR